MLASEVVQHLNEASGRRGLGFPDLCLFFPVDVRLSVYRQGAIWALILEMLVFNDGPSRHPCCSTMLYCYGNNLSQRSGVTYPPLNVTGDGPSGPLFDSQDPLGHCISPNAKDMALRGKVVPITTQVAEYNAAGIALIHPPRILGYELLRLVAPKYRRSFLATESEIVERIGEPMPLLLRLNEWRHPDRARGEMPADIHSFQMIAEVIARNDPTLYQPTERPNTHWSNWPMAGML
jgi:hypothetical protein